MNRKCCFCGQQFDGVMMMQHIETKESLCVECITGANRDLIAMATKIILKIGVVKEINETTGGELNV